MSSPPTVRIFFSSPGDVKMERETARRIVERLQAEVGSRATLEPYFWEHEVMRATRDYQQNIPAMDGFDVVVCILWSRLGSPLNPERHPRPGGGCFESGTEYEFFMAMEAHRSRGLPDVLVFRNRTEPRRPSRPKEAREAVDREIDRLDQFFESYFRTGEYYTVAANSYRTLGEFEEKLTQGLHAFLDQRLPAPGPRARPVATYRGRPYLGLAAFDFADAPVFFGRTAQVGEVVEAFQAQELEARAGEDEGRRFVLVFGASGSGKSSLARAGVLPMLVQPGVIEGTQAWRRAILKPGAAGGDPFLALATALLAPEALPELGSDGTGAPALARLLRGQPGGAGMLLRQALNQAAAAARAAEDLRLRERLRQLESDQREDDAAEMRERLARLAPPAVRLALLADQLEELFTTDQTAEARAAFVECLASIARSGRVFVLGTLRSDFYANCLAHPRLVELMRGSGTYALPAPGPAELGLMIRQPAAAAGLSFEENPATGEKLDELLRDAALRDPAALPLLGYTLEQLYERRTSEGLLTLEAYKTLGGLEGAIGRRAEEAFAALPGAAQAAFDAVWRQLVTLGERGAAVRRRAEREALAASPGATDLVDALVAARLFTADKAEDGKQVVSVVHEALLRHWPRVLRWIEENREYLRARSRLAARLKEWLEEQRDEHYLIPTGPALGEAESLLARHGAALEPAEVDYIRRSAAHARTREQVRQQRNRRITIGAVVLSVLAIAGGVYAWKERSIAKEERETALEQKKNAERNEVRAAYLLGIEQLESGKTREGLTNLVQTLRLDPAHAGARDRLYSYHLYGLPKPINLRSTTGPDRSRQQISTGQHDGVQRSACLEARGAAEVVDLATMQVVPGPWSAERDFVSARLNRTGTHLLCRRRDHRCCLWQVDGGRAGPLIEIADASDHVECSDDGSLLVEGGSAVDENGQSVGRVRVWDVGARRVRDEWNQPAPIESIELDSARGRLATVGGDVVFYDLAARERRGYLSDPGWVAQAIRFAEAADIAVLERRGLNEAGMPVLRFSFVDARSGADLPGAKVVDVQAEVFDFAVSREGTILALAPFASNAELHFRTNAATVLSFPHPTYPAMVRFSPDETQLLTASSDGTVRVFDLATTELVIEPIHHDGRLGSLALSWDSRFLLTSTNHRAWIWDLAVSRAVALPLPQPGKPFACGFDAAGSTIWTACSGSGVQAWDARTLLPKGPALGGRPLFHTLLDEACGHAVLLLPDRSIRVIDLRQGTATGEAWHPPPGDLEWALSGDGARVAVAVDATLTLLDCATGGPIGSPWSLQGKPTAICLGGDGRIGAFLSDDGRRLVLHDSLADSDTELQTLDMKCALPRLSRDDRWLAAAATDEKMAQACVLLWDLRTPAAPPKQLLHNDEVRDLRFSPDGRWLATGTKGQIAQVWNVQTGDWASSPIIHADNVVLLVRFSPDSRRLAISYGDHTLRLYDWSESRPVSEVLRLHENPVDMAFSPDGTRLVTICPYPNDPTRNLATGWELAPPANLRGELVALTEAATALRFSKSNVPEPCDPFGGWERVRIAAPDLWFFLPPARRWNSPAFEASNRRWMVENATTYEQAYYAMPAVGMVRAALAFWRQQQANELRGKIDPTRPATPEEDGQLQMLELAVGSLRDSASRCAGGDAMTSLWLGRQRAIANEPVEARRYLEDALRLAPEDREILVGASEGFRDAGDCDSERRTLERLRRLDPTAVKYRVLLGYNLWRCGDRAAAQAEFGAVVDDSSLLPSERAEVLCCLGRYAEALTAWKEAAQAELAARNYYPTDTLAFLAIGHQLAGKLDDAVTCCQALIEREPAFADPKRNTHTSPLPEFREALQKALEETLARYPELRPK